MKMVGLNQRGSLILNALIVTLAVGITAGVIMQRALDLNRNLRTPRVKSSQSSVELSLRYLLLQPTVYGATCDATGGGSAECVLNMAEVAKIFEPIVGCVGATPCGVHLDMGSANFNGASRTFNGRIVYDGNEVAIAPRLVTIVVPVEVLQSASALCGGATPIFAGFDAAGHKICRAFPNSCGAGMFVSGFNSTNLAVVCQSLDAAAKSCPAGSYMSSLNWSSGGTLTFGCSARPLPSTLWPVDF